MGGGQGWGLGGGTGGGGQGWGLGEDLGQKQPFRVNEGDWRGGAGVGIRGGLGEGEGRGWG